MQNMNYYERLDLRGNILNRYFRKAMPLENYVRDNWQATNYLPTNDELKNVCNQICLIAQVEAKEAFEDNKDLYKRFKRECEEITNRFMKLDADKSVTACCGVYQVNNYLYEEIYDLVSESMGIVNI